MTTINSVGVTLSGQSGTGNFVGTTSPSITTPEIITAILDSNGNDIVGITATGSAVNYIQLTNNITANPPIVSAVGSDTNIILELKGKGTGGVAIQGTTAGGSATTGYVGEFVSSSVTVSSAVALTTSTNPYNVTSISLSAGDWDVFGNVVVIGSGQNVAYMEGWISTSSATKPDLSLMTIAFGTPGGVSWGIDAGFPVPYYRVNVTATTTPVYLSASADFPSGSATACGNIYARRVR